MNVAARSSVVLNEALDALEGVFTSTINSDSSTSNSSNSSSSSDNSNSNGPSPSSTTTTTRPSSSTSSKAIGTAAAGELYDVRPTEYDVNRVIYALKTPASSSKKMPLGIKTEKWLEDVKPSGSKLDPLDLSDMSDRIKKRV